MKTWDCEGFGDYHAALLEKAQSHLALMSDDRVVNDLAMCANELEAKVGRPIEFSSMIISDVSDFNDEPKYVLRAAYSNIKVDYDDLIEDPDVSMNGNATYLEKRIEVKFGEAKAVILIMARIGEDIRDFLRRNGNLGKEVSMYDSVSCNV